MDAPYTNVEIFPAELEEWNKSMPRDYEEGPLGPIRKVIQADQYNAFQFLTQQDVVHGILSKKPELSQFCWVTQFKLDNKHSVFDIVMPVGYITCFNWLPEYHFYWDFYMDGGMTRHVNHKMYKYKTNAMEALAKTLTGLLENRQKNGMNVRQPASYPFLLPLERKAIRTTLMKTVGEF